MNKVYDIKHIELSVLRGIAEAGFNGKQPGAETVKFLNNIDSILVVWLKLLSEDTNTYDGISVNRRMYQYYLNGCPMEEPAMSNWCCGEPMEVCGTRIIGIEQVDILECTLCGETS